MQAEQILSQIRQKENLAVLIIDPDDELCMRSRQMLFAVEGRLRSSGFQVVIIEVSARTQATEELACVRVPQLRLFAKGKLQHKIVGLFDEAVIDAACKVLV